MNYKILARFTSLFHLTSFIFITYFMNMFDVIFHSMNIIFNFCYNTIQFFLYFYGKSSNKELAMTDNTDLTCVLLAKELNHVK